MNIGRLQRLDLRELWRHEAHNFTGWLAQNLDLLGDGLGMQLTLVQQEAAAGPFSCDILADAGEGHAVVIENQLEMTNHDHLGKLITYLSNLDAKTAIWISSDPRPEHERAIHWLNEVLPADTAFYLLRLEAYRIGESAPAPLFTIVAGPSSSARQAGALKKDLAERHVQRLEFWKQLLEHAKGRLPLFARISPSPDNWINASAGKSGLTFAFVVRMNDSHVEFYVDRGDVDENKRIFDALFTHKERIEESFGHPLEWQRLDDKRASRIRYVLPEGGLRDRDHWPTLHDNLIEAMVKLERAIKPPLHELKIGQ